MNRPAFLTSPGSWLHTCRHAQTPADYACSVQRPAAGRGSNAPWIVACIAGCVVIAYCLAQGI
jgi:hypothetical protein